MNIIIKKAKCENLKDIQILNNKLFEEVARQKQNGTFDYDALSKMIETLRGSLPENDYNNLKRILESLK